MIQPNLIQPDLTQPNLIQTETLELLDWGRLCQHLSTFAATKLGTIAARRLTIPTDRSETQTLLAQTQEIYQLETRLTAGLAFDGITDIGEALQRAERQGMLSGEELLAIATTLAGARNLRRTIDNQPDMVVLNTLVSDLRTYPELEQEIHRCIDDRAQVADRATPKLSGIREQQKQVRDRVHDILQGILQRKSNAIQESLITQRAGRFVVPVKAPQKDAIPGIVHDTSMSGMTLYVEPQPTVNLNNQLRQLQRQEQVECEAVLRSLTAQVAAVLPDLERLLAIVTTLDLATARARYSLWLGGNPPRFVEWAEEARGLGGRGTGGQEESESTSSPSAPPPLRPPALSSPSAPPLLRPPASSPIVLRQLRHPLLVWQQQHEQGVAVVPIDLVIQPQIRVVAITGPNTGGKTVTLKTFGLAVLMAKVGLFIPAREPVELPWFDRVLADIGDEQSLQQSLSTFSGHIRRIVRVLAALDGEMGGWGDGGMGSPDLTSIANLSQSNPHPDSPLPHSPTPPLPTSLVLLDEVGAGTDPSEGSALAIALLKHLADHAGLTIATTHFGELKALKYQDDRFENASVEFDDVLLAPTYRLLWGIPGRSNALTIARRLGLSEEVVQQAQTYVGGASEDVNQVIAGLEAQRRRQETKSQEAGKLLESAERLYGQVSAKAAALKERERDLKQAQEQAVQDAIVAAKKEVAQVIRQLQQGPMTAQSAQQSTDELNQLGDRHLPSRQQKTQPKPVGFRPQAGDRVRIPRLGQTAEVLTSPDSNDEISVRFGLMKMTVSVEDVESLDGQKAVKREPEPKKEIALPPPPVEPLIRTSRNTVDIRGSRVADAEPVIEKAISENMGGALWIIHGHGTGKLRLGVHAFLQQYPLVDRFELAPREDGGSGVTIAYLK